MTMQNFELGGGQVLRSDDRVHLIRPATPSDSYANAEIGDYREGVFRHTRPLRMSLTAQFSHPLDQLRGTAGFGFWNAPFAPSLSRLRFPKAAWFFFGSPPLDLPLAKGVPGNGFKAGTLDATHLPFFALLPTTPIAVFLMRIRPVYNRFWPIGQRAIRASEALLTHDVTQPHAYQLDWLPERVIFRVDGEVVHTTPSSPTGKMGFVAWIDNQYAIATPQGRFGWGVLEAESQTLSLQDLHITPL